MGEKRKSVGVKYWPEPRIDNSFMFLRHVNGNSSFNDILKTKSSKSRGLESIIRLLVKQ